MGRTWDALRRDVSAARESEPPRAVPGPVQDVGPAFAEVEEIPFIEVGPRKSVEASPSVLAYGLKKDKGKIKTHDISLPSAKPSAPPSAAFRAVFLVAPGNEAEMLEMEIPAPAAGEDVSAKRR